MVVWEVLTMRKRNPLGFMELGVGCSRERNAKEKKKKKKGKNGRCYVG